MVVPPPSRTSEEAHHLCLDKGYDNPTGHQTVEDYGYTGHVRRIGEEKLDEVGQKTHPARRWVVERDARMALEVPICSGALRSQG